MLTMSDLHNEQELSSFDMHKVVGGYINYSLHLGAIEGEIDKGASGGKSPSNTWDIAVASVDTGA